MPPKDEQLINFCFVIGPLGSEGSSERTHSDWLLHAIIQPVFEQHFKGTKIERSDQITVPGMIDAQIINRLLDCDLVIADLTLLNPNVFYEIGIRHMVQKPIIHMFLEGTNIPFDIAPYRAIRFKLVHPDNLESAKTDLKAAVDSVTGKDHVVENPVTRARGQLKLQQHATPEQQVLLEGIQALTARLDVIEGQLRRVVRGGAPAQNVFALSASSETLDTAASNPLFTPPPSPDLSPQRRFSLRPKVEEKGLVKQTFRHDKGHEKE